MRNYWMVFACVWIMGCATLPNTNCRNAETVEIQIVRVPTNSTQVAGIVDVLKVVGSEVLKFSAKPYSANWGGSASVVLVENGAVVPTELSVVRFADGVETARFGFRVDPLNSNSSERLFCKISETRSTIYKTKAKLTPFLSRFLKADKMATTAMLTFSWPDVGLPGGTNEFSWAISHDGVGPYWWDAGGRSTVWEIPTSPLRLRMVVKEDCPMGKLLLSGASSLK